MEHHNSDELQAPNWLNDQFFLDVIRKAQNDSSITLCHECKLRPGTSPGDHYGSVMFRTAVHYRSNRFHNERALSLIMKTTTASGGYKREVLEDNSVFEKEIKMYQEVLPLMTKLLGEVGEHLEVPRLIYAATKPHTIIILEDISTKGWQTGRELVTSFEETLPTIRNIAKFHATSLFLHQTSVDLSSIHAEVYTKELGGLDIFFKGFDEFCDAVQTWSGCEKFAHKFKDLQGDIKRRLKQVFIANPKGVGYNVLNHADLHWKNLLHKKAANGRIKDSMLIDYQCCNWGSPAVDVLSLLDMVVDHDTKKNYRKEMVYEYYQHFVEILNKIGYLGSIPTLADLHIELLRKGLLEVFHVVMFEQFKHIELTETTLDDVHSGKMLNPGLSNEQYLKVIRAELPLLFYKGLLD